MPIHGLVSPEIAPQSKAVDINDAAAVTLEALDILRLVGPDKEAVRESITREYTELSELAAGSNETGELYVDIPYSMISTGSMVEAIDSHGSGSYPNTFVWPKLWTPGAEAGSYSDEQLAKSSGHQPTARLARHTDEASDEPLLHFLGMPYDNYAKEQYNSRAEKTQLEALAEQKDALESVYPEFVVSALGHRAFLLLGLQRRIKGEDMPISWGFMRDANLPRTQVDGGSVVGSVFSYGSELGLNYSSGGARPNGGVGLSVGQKEA